MTQGVTYCGKLVGHCSRQPICVCADDWTRNWSSRWRGCPYFTPTEDEKMLRETVTRAVEDWIARAHKYVDPSRTAMYVDPGRKADLIESMVLALRCTDEFKSVPSTAVERYCVIGVQASGRTWVATEAEAVEHAQKLFGREKSATAGTKLFVVKVQQVVEKAPPKPPEVEIRTPRASDFYTAKTVRRLPDED